MRAVGKLHVPGSQWQDGRRRHRNEDCSATLIAPSQDSREADVVITAWHCLEFYADLSRPLVFTLLPDSDRPIVREAYRLADGGGMHADWALLRLYRPVAATQVAALPPGEEPAADSDSVTLAGYSRDSGLGAGGNVLTYHAGCTVTHGRSGHSNCTAYKGASGGAVVTEDQQGRARFAGVVSRGDSERISIFVPLVQFRAALNRALLH